MHRLWMIAAAFAVACAPVQTPSSSAVEGGVYDVVVYGGTSAGVIAAVQAKKMGTRVVIVGPDRHLGGLSSGGLGWTDSGNKAVIGGLAREFYHRIWQHYRDEEAWRWQKREAYGNRGQGSPAIDGDERTMWIFEPHAAEGVFEDLVEEHAIPVHRDAWLDREGGVAKKDGRIVSIATLDGRTWRGKMFIDATYEGDLMAAAGVDYHVGREAGSVYGEKWNGVQVGVLHHSHHFTKPVDPYVTPGDPSSGVLPRISTDDPGEKGEGDKKVQAYCFRMCLTNHPENRAAFPRPAGYDPDRYALLLRIFATGRRDVFGKFDPIPNRKTDTNNHGPFSTDNIGMNYDYPEAGYERRKEIVAEHETYQKGLMYFLANDPRVPAAIRKRMSTWGLAKDEFRDNGHWPHQIYVREARRMIGAYVMTEHDCFGTRRTPAPVGMGSYTLDSHNVQRYITPDGHVQNEGDIGVHPGRPYLISYRSLTPKKAQCENLLVPVCVSSSHIAFGSIRMEPVFMILGQSAATAACLAIDAGCAVQDLSCERLRARLLADGQVLEHAGGGGRSIAPRKLKGVVVDDEAANLSGTWTPSRAQGSYVGRGYRHDGNANKGGAAATFTAKLRPGRYAVRVAYTAHGNRATNVPVTVRHAGGETTVTINQRKAPTVDKLAVTAGTWSFGATAAVVIANDGTDGYVIADAVQFVSAE